MRFKMKLFAQPLSALDRFVFCKEHPMLDVVVLALGLIFFAATIAYVYACDRL